MRPGAGQITLSTCGAQSSLSGGSVMAGGWAAPGPREGQGGDVQQVASAMKPT